MFQDRKAWASGEAIFGGALYFELVMHFAAPDQTKFKMYPSKCLNIETRHSREKTHGNEVGDICLQIEG